MSQEAWNILVSGQNFFQLQINHIKKYLFKTELKMLPIIQIQESECDLLFNLICSDKLDEIKLYQV